MGPNTKLSLWFCFSLTCFAQQNTPSALFEFHSGFWLNLHHYLYQQATAEPPPPPASPVWEEVIQYYRTSVTKTDLLEDASARVNLILSQSENQPSIRGSGLPEEVITALERVAPDYQRTLWPEHDRQNRAWINAASTLLRRYPGLDETFVRVYGVEWTERPIRTDVAVYADRVGAYTTLEPTHITISSTASAYQGNAALEMLYHEASHALIGKVRGTLATQVRSENRLYRASDLWHAILFYTAGEIVRQRIDGYTPYAVARGLYTGRWDGLDQILAKDWKPYLDGDISLADAAQRLADSFGVAQ